MTCTLTASISDSGTDVCGTVQQLDQQGQQTQTSQALNLLLVAAA
jgi:hypothetical protein